MTSPRLLKKYPNRRLYDTVESRYVTLPHIRDLILKRVNLTIVDADSNADVTPSVLLQVIVDMEQNGGAQLDRNFLCKVIRGMAQTRRKKAGRARSR